MWRIFAILKPTNGGHLVDDTRQSITSTHECIKLNILKSKLYNILSSCGVFYFQLILMTATLIMSHDSAQHVIYIQVHLCSALAGSVGFSWFHFVFKFSLVIFMPQYAHGNNIVCVYFDDISYMYGMRRTNTYTHKGNVLWLGIHIISPVNVIFLNICFSLLLHKRRTWLLPSVSSWSSSNGRDPKSFINAKLPLNAETHIPTE